MSQINYYDKNRVLIFDYTLKLTIFVPIDVNSP